ncbi:MAG: hypothetical protein AAB851_02810 [Patescibacteria group bacterium]
MPDFNLQVIKLKIFLKENLIVILGVFLAVVLAAGLAVYWFTVEKPAAEVEKKAAAEEEMEKIIESLTAPEEPKMTAEEKKEILKDLSAPQPKKSAEMTEEEKKILELLSAPK